MKSRRCFVAGPVSAKKQWYTYYSSLFWALPLLTFWALPLFLALLTLIFWALPIPWHKHGKSKMVLYFYKIDKFTRIKKKLWRQCYLPSFYVIVVATSAETQFKLSLVTYAGKVLDEGLVNLSEIREESSEFPGFFWSVCRDEFNLCSGIQPPDQSSSSKLLIEHCDKSYIYRSKECKFISQLSENGLCKICDSFPPAESKDSENFEQVSFSS